MTDINEIAAYAVENLKKKGADDAQVVVSRSNTREMNIDGGEISLIRSMIENAISLKAIKDGKKGTISINKFSKEEIDKAVQLCMEAAEAGVPDDAVCIAQKTENKEFTVGAKEEDMDGLFDRLEEYLTDVKREFPRIMLEQVIVEYEDSDSVLQNSNGVNYRVKQGGYYFSSMFSAHEGEKTSSFNSCGAAFNDLSRPLMDLGMQRTLYAQSEKELDAEKLNDKFTGKILISPNCLENFIDMALSSFASDTSIIDGTSPWKDSLGKKVASEKLNISFAPLDPRMAAGERVTNDGYISENYDMIQNGVLKDFGLSEYAARKTGNTKAPNTSGCMIIAHGEKGLEEILKSIDKGLLVCRFSGGTPAVNGDFSGVAKNSFLIENGEIKNAVTETMISGNLSDMLHQIIDLSKETAEDGSSVLPYALVDGITVSG